MGKTDETLRHFFSRPMVNILLPHVIHAERTTLKGQEKKALLLKEFGKTISSKRLALPTEESNLTIPWPVLFPILIDAFLEILNIILGKKWIKEVDERALPPPGT